MHELSIAVSIVDCALEEAERLGSVQVEAIHLRLGRLGGVDKEALLFSYAIASQDTVLARARLVIEDVEVVILCPKCGEERRVRSFPQMACSECGTAAVDVVHGDELEVTGMEIVA
jgi:hydrogenase nickel incorporation protein HypA/HybF